MVGIIEKSTTARYFSIIAQDSTRDSYIHFFDDKNNSWMMQYPLILTAVAFYNVYYTYIATRRVCSLEVSTRLPLKQCEYKN